MQDYSLHVGIQDTNLLVQQQTLTFTVLKFLVYTASLDIVLSREPITRTLIRLHLDCADAQADQLLLFTYGINRFHHYAPSKQVSKVFILWGLQHLANKLIFHEALKGNEWYIHNIYTIGQ